MRLESARELKRSLLEHELLPLVARSAHAVARARAGSLGDAKVIGAVRASRASTPPWGSRAVAAGPVASKDERQRAIAIGIAPRSRGAQGYQIAVRVQRRSLLDHSLVERIRKQARNEVDVRYVGRIQKHSGLRGRLRPLHVGTSVAHHLVTAGTLGAFVKDSRGRALILSNNHVLANEDRCARHDAILQPGPLDGGLKPADIVGFLERWVRLSPHSPNRVDAAVARLAKEIEVTGNSYAISARRRLQVSGSVVVPDDGIDVVKLGRSTEYRRGRVSAIDVDYVVVAYDIGNLTFMGQIEIESSHRDKAFSDGGDSGSLIMTPDGEPLGLLFAGADTGGRFGTGLTYANPISDVLSALKVNLLS